ncbi:MAG: TRAP transporter large permease subunit [Litorivicinaceae bacterium]|jgi:C4-dicarboxylate transporter, DctM subunit|nr:TRAP transporter large permease subunit [Litorivicinaceae bacterium]MDP5329407.1 TRAP transporter large permease subunit [Litorivicinaceae bacterium]MDP5330995.1 TRAP transporter large permease subunit [Litorivicinaceae bacterium]MDP5342237.1 TRAP transporter large permease subunit [Litorivicinaceae bacterium]MDP5344169.1 TRAP transporter large permease subunit [Litorivicinaceae bacterium]
MTELWLTLAIFIGLIALLAMGIWVGIALLIVGLISLLLFANAPAGIVLATTTWGTLNSWSLAALPLFIWMGEILFRSRLSTTLFSGLAPWLGGLPGRLLHVNIFGSAVFAAVSGSSAATAATIGKMSMPELRRRGYPERLMIGTLAGSATLGLLIPPSIILIVYGVATDQSIARLFIAGIAPGALLVALFAGYVIVWGLLNPSLVPREEASSLRFKLRASRDLLPVIGLIVGVIGSVYAGLASPTDAAALGVVLALLLTAIQGDLTWSVFTAGLLGAVKTSCMIGLILVGAGFLTVAMGFAGIPRMIASWIGELGLTPGELLIALTLFFVVLGCFLDGISIVVLTTSIIMPMVLQAGIDPIWFGIYLVLVVEMSQITPPVGFNLFVLQTMTQRNILQIALDAVPFFLLMVFAIVLITWMPEIVLTLPNMMGR